MTEGKTRLSVVVAHIDTGLSVGRAVAALERSCRAVQAEIVIVQTSDCPWEDPPRTGALLRRLRVQPGALVPQLWAEGLAAAGGEYVAFTLANCEVGDGWASAVVAALDEGAAGVAGPIGCAPQAGVVTRALYYLRYSGFMPGRVTDTVVGGDIPGDNAAYVRAALMRHRDAITDGFWEVAFHRRLLAEGGTLSTRRGAAAQFFGGVSLATAMRHRFAHGRHYGAWRVRERLRRRWQIAASALLVPPLLWARAARRVLASPSDRVPFLVSTPVFVLIASAWAVGEVVGAMVGSGLPAVAAPVAIDPRNPVVS